MNKNFVCFGLSEKQVVLYCNLNYYLKKIIHLRAVNERLAFRTCCHEEEGEKSESKNIYATKLEQGGYKMFESFGLILETFKLATDLF